jgi:nucleoid DNA-binding protein
MKSSDKIVNGIIAEIAKEEGLDKEGVAIAVSIVFAWLKQQIEEINYPYIFYPKFGTFKLIEKKLNKKKGFEKEKEAFAEFVDGYKKLMNPKFKEDTKTN